MIRPLTSLRFVFAFMVFCSHFTYFRTPGTLSYWLTEHVMSEGYIGVSFFFILSGFILSYNYAGGFEAGTISRRDFWLLRFARIYPLYLATLLVEIPFTLHEYRAGAGTFWAKLATCTVMLQSWVPDINWVAAFNMPSWSISVEAFFYAVFPLLVLALKSPKKGLWICLAIMVLIGVAMSFTPAEWQKNAFYNNPLGRLGEFVLGIVLYRIYAARKARSWSRVQATAAELGAIALFIAFFAAHELVPKVYRFSVFYWLPMAVLLYVFAWSKGAISGLISAKPFVILGEASFAFYMIHYRAGGMLKIVNRRLGLSPDSLSYFLVYLAATIIGSIAVYYLFERPVNYFLRQKLLPRGRSALVARHAVKAD